MLKLVELVAGRPWAIQGEIAAHVRGLVAREGIAGLRHLAELKATMHGEESPRVAFGAPAAGTGPSTPRTAGAIAVVPIIGTLTQRGDVINSVATRATDSIAAEVAAWARDPAIGAIVLDVDSPGGEVFGVPEAFRAIREAGARKPVVASVNSISGSAAYYLTSAATEVFVTPSGVAGSIGVYMLHVDASRAIEQAGEHWTFISAGKYKIEGNPVEPLGDEARAYFQAEVDRYYGLFARDVAKGRQVEISRVRDGFGQGRMLGAQAAVAEGMADQVGTFGDALRRAARLARDGSGSSAAVRQSAAATLGTL